MPFVIGTAGHIDHGKSSLVRALTGIDPDRLKEEKERGITIELGFAHLDLPKIGRVSIVDVPGHERFVRHMVAGAQGVDAVMLVVAADEGVMPQTREHLDICRLLGVKQGLVAMTKSDLVEEDFLLLAIEDARAVVAGTFLEEGEILPVSATSGEGIPALKEAIARMIKRLPARFTEGVARLPVDRVFTLKGFGTVVTGTMLGGRFRTGDAVEVSTLTPRGLLARPAKIRSLQVHGEAVSEVSGGQRAALCLAGVERAELERGATVATPGVLKPTRELDVRIYHLAHNRRPLPHRASALFHLGTAQARAQVLLLQKNEIPPGEEALARLRLDRPVVGLPGERFILRGFEDLAGHGRTTGGGEIIDVSPLRLRKRAAQAQALLPIAEAFASGSFEDLVLAHLRRAGSSGASLSSLVGATGLSPARLEKLLGELGAKRKIRRFDAEGQRYVSQEAAEELSEAMRAAVKAYHELYPMRPGIPREELRSRLPEDVPVKLFGKLLDDLLKSGELLAKEEILWTKGFTPRAGDASQIVEALKEIYAAAGRTPPRIAELPDLLSARGVQSSAPVLAEALSLLRTRKVLCKVSEELYFDAGTLLSLRGALVAYLKENGRITPQQWKELVGATRKYTIPLAEYFDREKVTLRVGDERILRPGAASDASTKAE